MVEDTSPPEVSSCIGERSCLSTKSSGVLCHLSTSGRPKGLQAVLKGSLRRLSLEPLLDFLVCDMHLAATWSESCASFASNGLVNVAIGAVEALDVAHRRHHTQLHSCQCIVRSSFTRHDVMLL